MTLPRGPSSPAVVQTARWLSKPVDLLEDCRDRYGEAFTLNLIGVGESVWISEPEALKQLFGLDKTNRLPPGRSFLLEPVMGPQSLLLQEGAEHLRRRRLMLPAFHGERMKAYEGIIESATLANIEKWPVGAEFRLHPRMQEITLEVIMRAVFGVTDPGRLAKLRELLPRLLGMAESGASQAFGLAVRRLGRYGPWRLFQRLMDKIDAVIADEIADRRASPDLAEREDMLSMLVAARDEDGEPLGDDELRDQLMTLLLAGHETTATGLAWTFDLLFRNQGALERLTNELPQNGDEYLGAVIEESLRVRPVVPLTGRKLTEAARLGALDLPGGTTVMAAILLAHTREDTYPNPNEFRPERFLADETASGKVGGRPETFSWIPFGGGTRRCIGAAFATMEMRVVLRTVLTTAELRGARSGPEPVTRRNITLSPKHQTPAVLERRLP